MKRLYAVLLVSLSLLVCLFASCISREAAERRMPESEEEDTFYTVTFYDGQSVIMQLAVPTGGKVPDYPKDYAWRDETGHAVDFKDLTVNSDMRFYVVGNVALRTEHVHYLAEQTQTLAQPTEQPVQTDQPAQAAESEQFVQADQLVQEEQPVQADTLAQTAVQTQFRPDEYVTRGQAAQIVCALIVPDAAAAETAYDYSDVAAGSQYYDAVRMSTAVGVMRGYSDGTFRPDEPITRGELLTVLCRLKGVDEVQALAFPDVTAEHWSLGSVAAAMTMGWVSGYEDGSFYPDYPATRAEAAVLINRAIGRTPDRMAINTVFQQSPFSDVRRWDWAYYDIVDAAVENELLSYILGEAEGMRPGFMLIGEQLCHVNADMRLDYFEAGFHKVEDGLETDGVYYVPENGYFVRRNQAGLQEFDGAMFYVPFQDGPYVCDYNLGYLHFGSNGRYTSKDEIIDGFVNTIMEPIIQGDTNNLLREDKLREAYNAIVFGGYGYKSQVNGGWPRGSTNWTITAARIMFQEKRGTCYYWAAAFLQLARRLGFQAYPICGGVYDTNRLHAWVMIDDADGNEYIYDTELDWAFRTGAGGRTNRAPGMDMFKQLRGHARVTYIFPGDTYVAPPIDEGDLFEDTPAIIWPTEVDGVAFIEIEGERIPLLTTWTELLDEAGNVIGYTIMAEYEGTTYSSTLMLETPIAPQQTDDPMAPESSDQPIDPDATDQPVNSDQPVDPGVTTDPGATTDPGVTDQPGATTDPGVTDQPGATTDPGEATTPPDTPTTPPDTPTTPPDTPTTPPETQNTTPPETQNTTPPGEGDPDTSEANQPGDVDPASLPLPLIPAGAQV